jgi:adenylate cyclase
MGRTAEAKEALEKAITMAPARFDNFVRGYVRGHVRPRLRPEDHAHMIEGLRKAGWQG